MNLFWQRVSGIAGIMGGIILFAGDMLFYYNPESTDLLYNMAHASDMRIVLSGVFALLSAWFYLLGLGNVYFAFKPAPKKMRNIVLLSFGAIFVAYGIIHAEYVAIAATAKISAENNLNLPESTSLAKQINMILRMFVYPLFALLSVVFIVQVWKRKTLYPRWIILFFPLIPFLLKGLIEKLLSGKMLVIIMGGYFNLICILFFLASTIALWNIKENRSLQ